jgi:serine/threonine protein kinase
MCGLVRSIQPARLDPDPGPDLVTHSTPNESTSPAPPAVTRQCPRCGTKLKADLPEGLCPVCLLKRGLDSGDGVSPARQPFVPPTVAELGKLFPQLEVLAMIGQGGMGAVYKARQPSLDRLVALKILARPSSDLDFASRFTQEARALARLSHPNIVAVYDFGQAGNLNYFLMEFVDGPNLRQVQQAGQLTPSEALQIIPQICAALQFAHDEAIVHRDIKPENVLLDRKGRVKIADFGLAKILGQEPNNFRLTGARDIVGTPHYMAPEQVEKPQEVDHRADIYSLGVVFYEMLTGELPLGKFQPPSAKVQMDVRLDEVVLRTLEKEPARRYQHVSEVKTRVETIAAGKDTQADQATSKIRSNKTAWVSVFVAILVVELIAIVKSTVELVAIDRKTASLRAAGIELVAHWSGEGDTKDSIGENNGTQMQGVTFSRGAKEQGFQLDGINGGVMIPASPSLNVGTNSGLAIEAWVKPNEADRLNPVVEWSKEEGFSYGVQLALSGHGNFYANIVDTSRKAGEHMIKAPPNSIVPGIFQHIALTYSRNTGIAVLYHNGLQVAAEYVGKGIPQTSYNLHIGQRPLGGGNRCTFKGTLDEISIFGRCLSAAEVLLDYKRQKLRLEEI